MIDKKEIYDYLRNRQKAAEIEAKVNGINLWVLIGAIAIVAWQLIPSAQTNIWSHQEIILRVLLLAEAIYLISFCMSPTSGISEEVRYSSQDWPETESALLGMAAGTVLLLPPALSLLVVGKSFSAFPAGLFGLAFVIIGTFSITKQLIGDRTEAIRLPKLQFRPTKRSNIIATVIFGLLFAISIVEQSMSIWEKTGAVSGETLKSLALIAALYLLVLISLQRLMRSHSLLWTYELETDLLLDAITPQIALRRIEHRALGPRLRDVMDTFFDDLDNKFGEWDALSIDCRAKLAEVPNIPAQYITERETRIANAIEAPSRRVEAILRECSELSEYLKKLHEQQRGRKQPAVIALLPSLIGRHKEYEGRAKKAKAELETMRRTASSGRAED